MQNNLYRDEHQKKIGGVCAGLADYFKVEHSTMRLIFLLAIVLHGISIPVYLILWIVLPKKENTNPVFGFTPPPLDATTFMPVKKSPSTFAIVFGMALILFGSIVLLNNFNLLPNWDFENLWPLVLVIIGIALIFSPKKNRANEKHPWEKTEPASAPASQETTDHTETI